MANDVITRLVADDPSKAAAAVMGGIRGKPLERVPDCNYVEDETGNVYPMSEFWRFAGDVVKPYHGKLKDSELSPVEVAFLRMSRAAETPEEKNKVRKLAKDFKAGKITRDLLATKAKAIVAEATERRVRDKLDFMPADAITQALLESRDEGR